MSRVVDGDTVELEGGDVVRYLGLDTPELESPHHAAAASLNRRLAEGREADLHVPEDGDRDRYGRILGSLHVALGPPATPAGEPLRVSEELVRRGLAWVYRRSADSVPPDLLERLLDAQADALAARRGVWRGLGEISPRDLRATRLRLHRARCEHIRGIRTRAVEDLERELRLGKSPCRSCAPLAR